MSTEADGPALAERMALKMFVEACLVLEEGVCSAREIDFEPDVGALARAVQRCAHVRWQLCEFLRCSFAALAVTRYQRTLD